MTVEHQWKRSWPGNFCVRCGYDDPFEQCVGLSEVCVCVDDMHLPENEKRKCTVVVAPCSMAVDEDEECSTN
jgi:hypothetical protein